MDYRATQNDVGVILRHDLGPTVHHHPLFKFNPQIKKYLENPSSPKDGPKRAL